MDYRVKAVIRQLERWKLPSSDSGKVVSKNRYAVPPAKVSNAELADSVNLSASRLRLLFKAETGLTIQQYVKRQRLQRAQELARTTFLRVSEIADLLGFDDVSHFVRDFRLMFGVTPETYRRAAHEVHEQPARLLNSYCGN